MLKDTTYKWWVLAFLFVTFFLELGSRQLYNAALPQIKVDFADLGITDTQLGVVGTVFSAVFGVCLVVSGLLADFFGRKRVIVVGTALFSLAIALTGFADGLVVLIVCYGVLNAMGQCCIAPPCYSLISQYHDQRTRSTALGIFQSAVYFGIVLGGAFAGILSAGGEGGWRLAFLVFGGMGIVWAVILQFGLRVSPGIAQGQDKANLKDAFFALLKKPTAILIAVAFGMFVYAALGVRLWIAAFMVREFPDVGLARAAFHSVFWLNLGSFVALMLTARLLDRLGRNHRRIRLDVSVIGLLLNIAPVIWVGCSRSFFECCLALTLFGVTFGIYEAAHYPAMFDCISPRYRSAATGMTGAYAFIFGSFGPAVMGWMGDHLSMRAAFVSLAGFLLVGALVLVPAVLFFFDRDYIETGGGVT